MHIGSNTVQGRVCVCGNLNRMIMPHAISRFEGDLILHTALEMETAGEWVLMVGEEKEGDTDTLI